MINLFNYYLIILAYFYAYLRCIFSDVKRYQSSTRSGGRNR